MTPRQQELIRSSLSRAIVAEPSVGTQLYVRLFQSQPDLERLFRGDRNRQAHSVMQMLDTLVDCLAVQDRIVPLLYELGNRHNIYHVRGEHYDAFGNALIMALRDCLGDSFSADEEQAWRSAYAYMADIMREALPTQAR